MSPPTGSPLDGAYRTSVTRLADLERSDLVVRPLDRPAWATGQYVVGEITGDARLPYEIESPIGRLVEVLPGDRVVGALGSRAATLQTVGSWRDVGDDGAMEVLSVGGVVGRSTSASPFGRPVIPLRYLGHVFADGSPRAMADDVMLPAAARFDVPTVLIIGSSMDAGKTLAGKQIVRALKQQGRRVVAAKLTGVGRYRDVVAMGDAGADAIFDFVDAGLPSTVVPVDTYLDALGRLLAGIASEHPDVLVAEAGASPLEPYNGEAAVHALEATSTCVVLCASDPYSVVGLMSAFGITPDLVSGRASSTTAGIELVERLCDVPTLNLIDPSSRDRLLELLESTLGR